MARRGCNANRHDATQRLAPLVCLPTDLSDEAAAKLVAFLYELTEALERHYYPQLHRYYHPNDIRQCDLDLAPTQTDPPF